MTVKENIPFAKTELYGVASTVNNLEGTGTVYDYTPTLEIAASNRASGNGVIPVATAIALKESPNGALVPVVLKPATRYSPNTNNNNWLDVPTPTTPCIPNNNNNDWLNAPATQINMTKMKKKRKKKTVVAGIVGGVFGLVIGGPVFGIITGAITAVVVKKKLKRKEQSKLRKLNNARAFCQQVVNN